MVAQSITIAGYGDIPNYEQKPHLEIRCPCGASFITYEWLEGAILRRADKFIQTHPCSHDTKLPEKKQERISVRELVGSETAGFRFSQWVSKYHCIECGELLSTTYSIEIYFCFKCKKYFNIEKGK